MRRIGHLGAAVLLAACATAALGVPARAQQPVPGAPSQEQTLQPTPPSPVTPPFAPLFGPYTPPPVDAERVSPTPPFMRRGGSATAPTQGSQLVLTPSILFEETYTDNVFLDNGFKRADFITSATPGLLLGFRTPDFGLGIGYVFTSEVYARETELTDAMARWGASVATLYSVTPRLRLDLDAGYFEDNNTTGSGIAGVSTGRTRSRGATVVPGVTWQLEPLTTIRLRAAWYTQSFDQDQFTNVGLNNYDTYTFSSVAARTITPNLAATLQYQYLFSDVANGEDTEYHLVLAGVNYKIASDLSATVSVGPQITTRGQTGTTAAAQLLVTKSFPWGSLALNASRTDAPTGGVGGSAETSTVGLSATITNLLLRNLTLNVSPSYTNSVGNGSLGTTNSVNLQVSASYPVTRWMAAFLAYSFFRQRTSGADLNDIDANRLSAGLQLFEALRLR